MNYLKTSKEETFVFEDAFHAAYTAKNNGYITIAVYDAHEKKQTELREMSNYYLADFERTEDFWKSALAE